MICWMPVFRRDFDGKWEVEELVDDGDYIAAVGDSESSILIANY